MKEADPDLIERLPNGKIRCNVCEVRCALKEGERGFCRTRLVENGKLYTLIYGTSSGACADPIEKKPLYHFHPGSNVLSAGTMGCNFHCSGCQNWHISHEDPQKEGDGLFRFSPEDSVRQSLQTNCAGIAWTYNEPAIWFEHTYDTAVLAKEKGLYTVYVTNGYSTPEALDKIGPYLDAFRVDIKGFSRRTYKKISGIGKWEPILTTTKRAKEKWGMHVECVTNVTPTLNDSPEELREIATWIHDSLGPQTPWHVTRFHPHLELSHLPPTPMNTLKRTFEIGKEAGLHHVYVGNVPGHEGQDTHCPTCGKVLVERNGFGITGASIADGKCPDCSTAIYGVWPKKVKASSGRLFRVGF